MATSLAIPVPEPKPAAKPSVVAYNAPLLSAPLAYSAYPAPLAYSAGYYAPTVYSAGYTAYSPYAAYSAPLIL